MVLERVHPQRGRIQDPAWTGADLGKVEGVGSGRPVCLGTAVPGPAAAVVAAGAAGAGVYFNNIMTKENNQRTDLYNAYLKEGGSAEGTTDLNQSQAHGNKAKTASGKRNASYIISGLGAVGFVLTFVF